MELILLEAKLGTTQSKTTEALIRHNGQEVSFICAAFKKQNGSPDIFKEINLLLASNYINTNELFQYYVQARELFDRTKEQNLFYHLEKICTNIANIITVEKVQEWITFYSDIRIPDSFDQEYTESNQVQKTPDRTYIASEYKQLLAMSIVLRLLVPIWGEYIYNVRDNKGTDFKDSFAVKLIRTSKLCESAPWDKLDRYVRATIGNECFNREAIQKSVSSEEFPEWIMSFVVVRRLCVGPIHTSEAKANLITFIHKYIITRMKGEDTSETNRIRDKKIDSQSSQHAEKSSTLDQYKLKHRIPSGDVVEVQESVRDVYKTAFHLDPEIDPIMLEKALHTTKSMINSRILTSQFSIVKWVMKPILSSNGIEFLEKNQLLDMFAIAQTYLWKNDHKLFALLVTSVVDEFNEDEFMVTAASPNYQLNPQLRAELERLFPFNYPAKKGTREPENLCIQQINNTVNEIQSKRWIMTCDDDLIIQYCGNIPNGRRFKHDPTVRDKLAQLVIYLTNLRGQKKIAQKQLVVPTNL